MKKVQEIRNTEIVPKPVQNSGTSSVPSASPVPLTETETTTLQILVRERDKIMASIGAHVGRAMTDRGLDPAEYAVSAADMKTIVKATKPQNPTQDAPAPSTPAPAK